MNGGPYERSHAPVMYQSCETCTSVEVREVGCMFMSDVRWVFMCGEMGCFLVPAHREICAESET